MEIKGRVGDRERKRDITDMKSEPTIIFSIIAVINKTAALTPDGPVVR